MEGAAAAPLTQGQAALSALDCLPTWVEDLILRLDRSHGYGLGLGLSV